MPALNATLKEFVAGVEWAGTDEAFANDVVEILQKDDITVIAFAGAYFVFAFGRWAFAVHRS